MTVLYTAFLASQIVLSEALGSFAKYQPGCERQPCCGGVGDLLKSQHAQKTRRDVMTDIIASSMIVVLPVTPEIAKASTKVLRFKNIRDIAQYINLNCNRRYLRSVRLSDYNFLYRGEDVNIPSQRNQVSAFVINDPSDLLDPSTYQSSEAVAYFKKLEDKLLALGSKVVPSNGHLATTCPREAARWGKALSIWPLGETGVDFAWLKDGDVFWPSPNETEIREIVIDKAEELDVALQGDAWEILFRTDSGVLAVSANLDGKLKRELKQLI